MVEPFGNYGESFNMSRAEKDNHWGREWVQISSLIVNPHFSWEKKRKKRFIIAKLKSDRL